ncbi:hypothetical protein ACRALDRAFT_2027381 [Sodiomyces alcalophilus JCM 7366]|uniref:uncharacterized protein n=1 Tax=Sodiomyces alcalophilus JCM 7366 TaxID=591952 RepID=UPI0039B6C4EA
MHRAGLRANRHEMQKKETSFRSSSDQMERATAPQYCFSPRNDPNSLIIRQSKAEFSNHTPATRSTTTTLPPTSNYSEPAVPPMRHLLRRTNWRAATPRAYTTSSQPGRPSTCPQNRRTQTRQQRKNNTRRDRLQFRRRRGSVINKDEQASRTRFVRRCTEETARPFIPPEPGEPGIQESLQSCR